MVDLLIVGGGLAGAIMARTVENAGYEFNWLISDKLPSASAAAHGLCCPVQFRNATPVWKADELFNFSRSFFQKYGKAQLKELSVSHIIHDQNEIIQWRQNVESTDLWRFTDGSISTIYLHELGLKHEGYIEISGSFAFDISEFITATKRNLTKHVIYGDFQNNRLTINENSIESDSIHYRKLIFCDGIYARTNGFFEYIPFNPCKGETLEVIIPNFQPTTIFHRRISIVPTNRNTFLVGSNFEWDNLDFNATDDAKKTIELELKSLLGDRFTYKIVSQMAGIRPTISDRRPVVGWHPGNPNLGILNGLGTRGLLYGPLAASNLVASIGQNLPILPDWNVDRFKKRWEKMSH